MVVLRWVWLQLGSSFVGFDGVGEGLLYRMVRMLLVGNVVHGDFEGRASSKRTPAYMQVRVRASLQRLMCVRAFAVVVERTILVSNRSL